MKGFKVTDRNRKKLVGVACNSLYHLLHKGREKLAIDEEVVAALDDGTIVDNEDYFQSLPSQTVIILYRKNEDIIRGFSDTCDLKLLLVYSFPGAGVRGKRGVEYLSRQFVFWTPGKYLSLIYQYLGGDVTHKVSPFLNNHIFEVEAVTDDSCLHSGVFCLIFPGVDFVLNVLRRINTSYLEAGSKAKDFLMRKTNELMDVLKESEKEKELGVWKNTPEEDPDWFADLETNVRTKDEYMFRKSQDRIRGYFYKFQEEVRKNKRFLLDPQFRETVRNCIEFFKNRLKADRYFGCYFDRRCALKIDRDDVDSKVRKRHKARHEEPIEWESNRVEGNLFLTYDKFSYCDSTGTFICQGNWKSENCEFFNEHHINPYLSREARILFSTWNLDHRIERSRSITPTLIQTIEACGKFQSVNFMYFYQLLFTKLNLKLVHIVCHDKSVHQISCDPTFFYT